MDVKKIACPNGCPVDASAKEGDKCLCGATLEKTCPECGDAQSNCEC